MIPRIVWALPALAETCNPINDTITRSHPPAASIEGLQQILRPNSYLLVRSERSAANFRDATVLIERPSLSTKLAIDFKEH